ncbi:MAG TPA: DUF2298 domain-containing protein [bacterium]|nr:DUF2298 domain-containing protein [bacterium]
MKTKKNQDWWAGFWRKPVFWLAVVWVLGGAFRFYNPNWDDEHSFHPDERNILGQTAGIQAGNGYRVQFFAYGQLPVFLYRATGELISTPQFWAQAFPGHEGMSQGFYWIFLAGLFLFAAWFFSREKQKLVAYGLSVLGFGLVLLFKFFPIFVIWFNALQDWPARLACFGWVTAAAGVISALLAQILEIEWIGVPFYAASGSVFLLGILPFFLPDAWGHTFAATAFALLILALGAWWAWVFAWARSVLALFVLWTLFASAPHGGFQYVDYGSLMITGRVWAAFFSTATIGAIFWLVRKIYAHEGLALLAAAFFAFSVVSIQVAHYCITESFITLMLVMVALLSFHLYERGDWPSYLTAGAAFGISMAAKTSSLYDVLILIMAHLLLLSKRSAADWQKEDRRHSADRDIHTLLASLLPPAVVVVFAGVGYKLKGVFQDLFYNGNSQVLPPGWLALFILLTAAGLVLGLWALKEFKALRGQMGYWIKLAAAGALAFLMFCLFSPWSLLDFADFQNSMNYEWHVVSIADACYVLQFKDTLRYLFHLQNLMSVELWWPLGVTAVAGALWVVGRLILSFFRASSKPYLLPLPFLKGKGISPSLPDLLLLIWFIPYFGFIGAWNTKFIRYMVPLIPFFCVFGARFLSDLPSALKAFPRVAATLRTALVACAIGGSLFYSMAYMHVYRFAHPWLESSVWIYKNVPPGSLIFNEAWGDGLPVDMNPQQDSRLDRPMSPGLYRSQDLTIYEQFGFPTDDSSVKRNYYANLIPQGDYISISSKKLWYTLTACTPEFKPHGFNAYPITSRYYRLLWSGLLGYKMVGEFHNFPSLFGWEHPDDMAEESFSVYDHPRVYLFKKVAAVSSDQILKLLSSDDYVRGIDRDMMRAVTPDNVDAFIESRRQYLQTHGLWDQLTAAPTPAASAPVPTVAPIKPKGHEKISAAPIAAAPTPEPTVVPAPGVPGVPPSSTLQALKALADHPVVEEALPASLDSPEDSLGYQARAWFSWVILMLGLGLLALPLAARLLLPLPGAAYLLGKILGLLVFAWLVWALVSFKLVAFTLSSCWIILGLFVLVSLAALWGRVENFVGLLKKWGKTWALQEVLFVSLFLFFTLVRGFNPHVHDPVGEGYNGGGEAGMDYGFLASVVRGESFPPQNMWMAGQPIGYSFYFGHLMMGVLTKTLGLVPAVTYNLGIISLFALIFTGAFALAYGLSGRWASGLIAGTLCALAGNLDGAKQYLRIIRDCLSRHDWGSLWYSTFDYWGPTRVIPHSINEFPYFSVLFADMHAHTLAMPFAMLLIGLTASLYLGKKAEGRSLGAAALDLLKKEGGLILAGGFLLGGIAFLNTWEVPTWCALLLLVLALKNAPLLSDKILGEVFRLFVSIATLSAIGLGLFAQFRPPQDPLTLGGGHEAVMVFGLLAFLAAGGLLFYRKNTAPLASKLLLAGLSFLGIVLTALVFWSKYFFGGFSPQQKEVLWVMPNLRTVPGDYFTIYGFFLSVLALGFGVVFAPALARGLSNWKARFAFDFEDWMQKGGKWGAALLRPQGAVHWSLAFGLALWCLLVGASWCHWTDAGDKSLDARVLGTLVGTLFLAGLWARQWVWALAASALGAVWLLLMTFGVFHLFQDQSPLLNLAFFTLLWFMAFLNLGFAVKTRLQPTVSFTFLLVALFFFVTATLEVFVMKEYLGGDYMRNNSLFKFGINAWTLASVAVGVLLPRLWDLLGDLRRSIRAESPSARKILYGFSFVVFSWILHALLDEVVFSQVFLVSYVLNLLFVLGILAWAYLEEWLPAWLLGACAALLAPLLILPLFTVNDYTSFLYVIQRFFGAVDAGFLFPSSMAVVILIAANFLLEKAKNRGLRVALAGWRGLVLILGAMALVYPLAGTVRKCHGFFPGSRARAMGYAESPTLNGLSYLNRENPYDAAAIRFLNERVPGQPCLIEAVGLGYNTWGSRYSIFTGLPALMGWDGHVREWVGEREDREITDRYNTTETIFNTHDVQLAKSLMDAYGVRLVVIGPLERGEADARKHYDDAGLAKFSTFLPLIYKNPKVEIYYNPPAEKS